MRVRLTWLILGLVVAAPLVVSAQRGRFGFGARARQANVAYDGSFTFLRAEYDWYWGWAADYPTMETNLNTILREITELRPHTDGTNVFAFDDAELFRHPIAYLSEPGYAACRGEVDSLHEACQMTSISAMTGKWSEASRAVGVA